MIKTKKTIFLALLLGMIIILLVAVLSGQSPLLVRIPDFHSNRGYPMLIILNPFRDRGPELAAESFLLALKQGECEEVTASLNKTKEICDKQRQYRLAHWKMIDLQPENGSYTIAYTHKSGDIAETEDMRVWVGRTEGNWRVLDFTIGY